MLDGITLPEDVVEWLQAALDLTLRQEREDEFGTRDALLRQAQDIRKKLESLYGDRLAGEVSDEFYRRMRDRWESELAKSEASLARLSRRDTSKDESPVDVLELAANASNRFKSANPEEKRELVSIVCQNSLFDGQKLLFELEKPFDLMLNLPKTPPRGQPAEMARTAENQDWWR